MLFNPSTLFQPSESRGDWFDTLLVAADYYKNGVSGVKLASKKIILMTNFRKPPSCDPDSVEEVQYKICITRLHTSHPFPSLEFMLQN